MFKVWFVAIFSIASISFAQTAPIHPANSRYVKPSLTSVPADLIYYLSKVKTLAAIEDINEAFKNPRLRAPTTEFGPTVIDMRKLPFESGVLDTGKQPWSSWWYPKIDRDFTKPIHAGQTAILEKYDIFARTKGTPKSAHAWELSRDKDVATWEGLCDAWAIASISDMEPVRPVTVKVPRSNGKTEDVEFSIYDLKGLLLKLYEATDESQFLYYGEKFLGNSKGWIYPDLFADEFHRLIVSYIGKKKQPLLMDHDAGVEVWTVPIFKANYKMERIEGRNNAVKVRMWLFTSGPTEPNDKEALGTQQVVRVYDYILTGDLDWSGTTLTVRSGEWAGGSVSSHPDYFFAPKNENVLRRSYNPNLDPDKVEQLLRQSY